MSVANNNLIREVNPGRSLFASIKPVISSSTLCTWNQGDILCMDSTQVLRPVTGSGDGTIVVGVAVNSMTNGVMPSPYQGTAVDASAAVEDAAGPLYGNVFSMQLASGVTFTPGNKIYLAGDPQTVTSSATGAAVGIFQGQAVTTSTTGTYGDCLIGKTYLEASTGGISF